MRFLSRQSGPGPSLTVVSTSFLALGLFTIIFSHIYFQKEIVLKAEGKVTRHRTRAQSVVDFLKANKVRLKKVDKVSPGLATNIKTGLTIEVKKAKPVIIAINEEKIKGVTTAQTAGQALDELGIKVRPEDKVIPTKKSPLVKNSHIKVTKKSQRFEIVRNEIPYQIVEEKDPSLTAGVQQELAPGKNGVVLKIFDVVSLTTRETKRLAWERTTSQPENKVVKLGTKVVPKARTKLASLTTGSRARSVGSPAP